MQLIPCNKKSSWDEGLTGLSKSAAAK